MASTRNKNTAGNYCLEQRQFTASRDWALYPHGAGGSAVDIKMGGTGLNPGYIPADKMSRNSADIEAFLWGINSTNLVHPAPKLTAELDCIPMLDLYTIPKPIMPRPMPNTQNNRPFPL